MSVSDRALSIAQVEIDPDMPEDAYFDEEPPPPMDPGEVDYGRDDVGGAIYTRDLIRITPDMGDVVDASEQALLKLGWIYQRAGRLCRVVQASEKVARIDRAMGAAVIADMSGPSILEALSRAAHIEKYDSRSGKWKHALPPAWIAETLSDRGEWSFPALRGVITAPTMRETGTILDTPGYDAESGFLLLHSGRWPAIKEAPTVDDARDALVSLWEAVSDFPFSDRASASAAIAAVLTIVGRPAFDGPSPLYVVGARDAGTGKTLLANVIATIGSGQAAPSICPWADPEEGRKTMLALALAGDPVGLLDNWPTNRSIGDEALDSALTSGIVRGRILGETRIVSPRWEMVLLVTGNNVSYAGDTARRTIPINLDARTENPEERTGFNHDPLLPWVTEHRKRLVVAGLTVLRAYVVAGRPSQGLTRIGSFEPWSDLVRSALVWAGYEDPAAGRVAVREASDPVREQVTVLLRRWFDVWGGRWLTTSEIRASLKDGRSPEMVDLDEAFKDLLPPSRDGTINGKALGKMLARVQGGVRGGLTLYRGVDPHTKSALWRVGE